MNQLDSQRVALYQDLILPTQSNLNAHVHTHEFDRLVKHSGLEAESMVRIYDMTAVNASAWIPPCYSSTGELSFNRYHFSLLVRRALGIPFIRTGARQQNETCPRKFVTGEARGKRCGALLDPRLFHASDGCKAIRYQRHYGVAKALTKVFRRAEYQVQLERQVLGCTDRPADLYIPNWLENRALAVDVTAVAAHRGEGKEPRAKVVGALLGKAERRRKNGIAKSFRIPKCQCRLFPLPYHPSGIWARKRRICSSISQSRLRITN